MKGIVIVLVWLAIAIAVLLIFAGSFYAVPVLAGISISTKTAPKFWRSFWMESYRALARIK